MAGAVSSILLLVTLASLAAVRGARAEVLPLVPDAIDTALLMRIADRLGASPEQRLAMLPAHDQYKAAFRAFEDREVGDLKDRFVGVATGFVRGGYRVPERKPVEELLDAHQRVLERAIAIDSTLFDSLLAIAGAEQQALLDEARVARQVAVYEGAVVRLLSSLNPGAAPNLEEIGRESGGFTTVEERQRVARYQRERLARLREAYGELRRVAIRALDLVDEMGLRELTPPELFERMQLDETQTLLRARFDEGTRDLQASAHALSTLNLRAAREIASGRPRDGAEAILDAYHTAAHDEVYEGLGAWRERFRAAAVPAEPELRAAIEGRLDELARRDDRLIASLADAIEESRAYRSTSRLSGEESDPAEERAVARRSERHALAEEAEAALAAILPPEALAAVDADADGAAAAPATGAEPGTRIEVRAEASAGAGTGEPRIEVAIEAPLDGALPPAVTSSDLDFYLGALAWDDDRRAVAAELFSDYRIAYRAAGAPRAPQESAPGAEDQAPGSVTEADREAAITSARSALDEIDRALFEDLASLESDVRKQPRIALLADLRQREAASAIARNSLAVFGREEAYLDLVRVLVEEEQASGGLPQAVEEARVAYVSTIEHLVAERVEIADDVARSRRALERVSARGGGEASQRLTEALHERLREEMVRARDLDKRITDLNRSTLEQIAADVPEAARWSLRERYNRRAWPDIYEDSNSAAKIVRAARDLDDLTDAQRGRLDEVAQQYQGGYRAISDRMVALRGKRSWDFESFDIPAPAEIDREIELARLGFDRDELSRRARLQARLLLDEEQRARIGLDAP